MKTLETTGIVTARGQLLVHVSPDIPLGEHNLVVVLDDMTTHAPRPTRVTIPLLHVGAWPKGLSLRREEIYGDDGR